MLDAILDVDDKSMLQLFGRYSLEYRYSGADATGVPSSPVARTRARVLS